MQTIPVREFFRQRLRAGLHRVFAKFLSTGQTRNTTEESAESAPVDLTEKDIELPDLVTDLQDKTQLTRASMVRIVTVSGRL